MKLVLRYGEAIQTVRCYRTIPIALYFLMVTWGAVTALAFSSADADTLFEAHNKAFYREESDRGWHMKSTD